MAITLACLQHIKTAVDALAKLDSNNENKILALGYPDIIASPSRLADIFDDPALIALPIRPDSAEIVRWHGAERITSEIVDSFEFFRSLGFDLEVADIAIIRGGEHILDLNAPCPKEFLGRYALLVDGGTCEHCFNIAQAAKNVAEMTKIGGFVISVNPMTMFNHGFYNLNPTWYYDFYEANGFSVLSLKMTVLNDPVTQYDVLPFKRFGGVPNNAMLLMLAQKNYTTPICWPIQAKYRKSM